MIDVDAWMNDDGGDCVEVEGLGTVAIRPMTAAEIDSCQKKGKAKAAALKCDDNTATTLEMIALTVSHPDTGKPLFPDGAGSLMRVPMVRLAPLIEAVSACNGFGEDVETLAGKSPGTESV